jgi:hypothetical protein
MDSFFKYTCACVFKFVTSFFILLHYIPVFKYTSQLFVLADFIFELNSLCQCEMKNLFLSIF